jgi:hypothetical protein
MHYKIFGEHVSVHPRVVTGEKNSPTVAHACRFFQLLIESGLQEREL